MRTALNIREAAKLRGFTLSSIAQKLKMARSNMSAISSGARGISLEKLNAISDIVGCGIDELVSPEGQSIFKDKRLEALLGSVEERNYDGLDKSWVNKIMFAHNAHYKRGWKAEK